ncbi:hypothetical protein [Dongia sp.]|uniref:hypothetical protein n=1 Tax=Dongia sp. TaxID=1977262 RepID=UPI0035B1FAEB
MTTPRHFTQTDVARACRGAMAAGLPVARVEIDPITCKIMVIVGAGTAPEAATEANEWDGADDETA